MMPLLLEWARVNMTWPLAIAMVVLGLIMFRVGLWMATQFREVHGSAKFGGVELTGAILFPFVGIVLILYPLWDPPGWQPPCATASCPSPSPSVPTIPSPSPSPSPSPTESPGQNYFRTPSGVECSTFTDRDAMACVMYVRSRTWAQDTPDCKIQYTLAATGEADERKPCPDENALSKQLTYYPIPKSEAMAHYGKDGTTFKMGSMTCLVVEQNDPDRGLKVGTTCTNPEGHGFRIARKEHQDSF